VVTLYLAWGYASGLAHQHSAISVLTAYDTPCLFGRARLHSGVHVLGIALLWQTYSHHIGVESSGKFLCAHLVFISTGMNSLTLSETLPVVVYDQVLDQDQQKSFLAELEQAQLELHTPYPNRIFTRPEHSNWLRSYFDPLINVAVEDAGTSGELQQIYLSWELPGCNFMYHRAHPNIGAVLCYSLDDFLGIELDILTEGFDDPDEYLWHAMERNGHKIEFKSNQAIMIKNNEPRHHWGFTAKVGLNRVKRNVWIYLGK
jgi:hypothetical protein